jgi:long-subunit fatty acid transport protein
VDGTATAVLNVPSTASLGCQVNTAKTVAIYGEAARTGWSRFKALITGVA